jgi:hypothetical protein
MPHMVGSGGWMVALEAGARIACASLYDVLCELGFWVVQDAGRRTCKLDTSCYKRAAVANARDECSSRESKV